MSSTKALNQLIEDGQSLKLITQSLGEIAAVRLSRIKTNVERNRAFYKEITAIYYMVKLIAQQNRLSSPNNNKTISVLLTSNSQFAGKINSELSRYFIKNSSQLATDRIVVGKTGQINMQGVQELPFKPLVFSEDLPSYQELKTLADAIKGYKRVLIYYSKMESMLLQKPAVIDITATAENIKAEAQQLSYIFEPQILVVLAFFDTQINILLLEQTLLESELSRVVNRLVSMSDAEDKADNFLNQQEQLLAVAKRSSYNLRVLETLISQINFRKGSHGQY